jgi:photosystem II stability/assembly factor-like uncharacterized protein
VLADPLVASPLTIQPSPSTPTTLFAGGIGGIAKSTDGGQSWRPVYSQPNTDPNPNRQFGALSIAIMPENPSRVLAVISAVGLIASDDGGETWAQVTGIPTPPADYIPALYPSAYRELIVDPGGSGTTLMLSNLLFISRDKGRTWKISGPGGVVARSAAFDPFRPGWIYASVPTVGFDGPIFLSADFGRSWTWKVAPANLGVPFSLLVDPEQPNRLYAATGNGVIVSVDGAASWVLSQQSAMGPSRGLALLPRACSGGGLFGISAADGVARSLDFASGWQSPQFGRVSVVATGPGCAVYAARNLISDAFVAKLAPGGTEMLWSTFLGAGSESADAMAIDSNGNVYVAGQTRSKEFPATSPRIGPGGGYWDVFVTKYDPSGYIVYSVVLAGGSWPKVAGVAADGQGSAYVVGATDSETFQNGRDRIHREADSRWRLGLLVECWQSR